MDISKFILRVTSLIYQHPWPQMVSALPAYAQYAPSYQLSVAMGSVAIPTTPIQIQVLENTSAEGMYTEVIAELIQSWHIKFD